MEVIFGISILFAALFMLSIFRDIIKTVIAKARGKEYTWRTSNIFTEVDGPIVALILGLFLAVGLYAFYTNTVNSVSKKYEREIMEIHEIYEVEKISCYYCDREMPEEFAYIYNNTNVCPKCVYGDYQSILNKLSTMPNIFDDDFMLLEKGECNWCGNYAPADLYIRDDTRVCVDCFAELIEDNNVARAISRYIEYN